MTYLNEEPYNFAIKFQARSANYGYGGRALVQTFAIKPSSREIRAFEAIGSAHL